MIARRAFILSAAASDVWCPLDGSIMSCEGVTNRYAQSGTMRPYLFACQSDGGDYAENFADPNSGPSSKLSRATADDLLSAWNFKRGPSCLKPPKKMEILYTHNKICNYLSLFPSKHYVFCYEKEP
jgi:hypothetical protein